ncbi:MAG: hypothetical protein QOG38_2257 [Hyphomicrobiales bacterium]|jgi:hypothetical protein|nr:hypothetical protein [Hyphomicrobiales bacterium]
MDRVLLAGAMFVMLAVAPAAAAPLTNATAASSELSAQSRPRLRVYPGRLLYRECSFRLVQEWRPNGIYVVPRQRCWWVRG